MPRQEIVKFAFKGGYATDLLSTESGTYLRKGSQNFMVNGAGLLRPFNGLTLDNTPKGSKKNFLTDDSYAGLGDQGTTGTGSVFKTIDLLMFLGQGELRVRGNDINISGIVSATTQLQYLTRNAGAFDNGSLLYQVGHARPTKPNLYMKSPPSAGQKSMNATVTVVVWRADSHTGQTSLPSPASDILTLTNGSVIVQVEGADSNGQDIWGVGVTLPGLSDLGNLYALPIDLGGEQLESALAYTRTVRGASVAVSSATGVDIGTDTLTSNAHPFVNDDLLLYTAGTTAIGGLVSGNSYYVVNKTANTFQVSLTLGGAAIDLTTTGVGNQTFTTTVTASILDTTNVVNFSHPPSPAFTAADLGRRISFSTFDSWITEIVDADTVKVNDTNTSGGTISGTNALITHAVDGITRAFEISWADTDLFGQDLAPIDAFEPPDGFFAGCLMDTYYIEDTEGTIFYSVPNSLSFPRDRKIFTEDKAVVYIDSGNGWHWRIANQSLSQIYYSPGEKPIQASVKSKVTGCKYPQNACLGYNGRLLLWDGRPNVIDADGSINSTFHTIIAEEFDGWEDQTADQPVVPAYDPIGKYELWIYGSKVLAFHAPSGTWCAPIDLGEWINTGIVVSQVIVDGKLRLVVDDSADLKHYKWDQGTGSICTLVTYHREAPSQQTTLTLLSTIARSGSTNTKLTYSIIKNFEDTIQIGQLTFDTSPDRQSLLSLAPNIRGIGTFAIKVVAEGPNPGEYAKGKFTIETMDAYGEWHESPDRTGAGS